MFAKGGVSKWKVASPLDFFRNGLSLQGLRQIGEQDACIRTRLGEELALPEFDLERLGVSICRGSCLAELDSESRRLTLCAVGGHKLRRAIRSLDGFNIKAKRFFIGN